MKYNPKNPLDKRQAEVYFNRLINGGEVFELRVTRKRNNDQNALLHAWIRVLQDHLGYTSFEDLQARCCPRNYRATQLPKPPEWENRTNGL